jgi:transcription elongation factor Elf1
MEQSCKHRSFSFEVITATGANMNIGIVRCNQCGTAIGAFIPQIPNALNVISRQLDDLKKDIQRIKS